MKLLRDLGCLIRSWWTHDRIQTSPAEGRLLRLTVGDLLSVDGSDFEIVDRAVVDGPHGTAVRLRCVGRSETAELRVDIRCDRAATLVLWQTDRGVQHLETAEIDVWPRINQVQ